MRPSVEVGVVGDGLHRLVPFLGVIPKSVVEPMPKKSAGTVELPFDAEGTRFRSLAREDTIAKSARRRGPDTRRSQSSPLRAADYPQGRGFVRSRNLEFGMNLFAALGFAAAFASAALASALPARADDFTPAQKQELGAFIDDYLVRIPRSCATPSRRSSSATRPGRRGDDRRPSPARPVPLFSSKYQATIGNPNASATLVEFFDYNCHYCKGALPDIAKLIKDDPNLKVVLKDFPVLGPGSVRPPRSPPPARNQLPGDRFWAFHYKLLGSHGPIGKAEAMAVAKDLGLDMDRLAKDMEGADVKAGLEETMQLADALQINGTPTFVLG